MNRIEDDYTLRRSILEKIRILIPYESAAFFLADLFRAKQGPNFFISPIGIDCEAGRLEEYVESAWRHDPMLEFFPLNSSRVFRESDFIGEDELSRRYYADFLGGRRSMTCTYSCDRGPLGSISLHRTRGDFTDREIFIMEVLEPHITERLSRYRLSDDKQEGIARFLSQHGITVREGEVLACLLDGESNEEISSKLCISPATVRKHLENLYRKTESRSRLDLVLKARQGSSTNHKLKI
ncbi:MAG: helix-turn-helix transcriptional regulator [Collinsella sp.]|nr:helix-turn-helix transcriptional regulator [Collinsella sp.]